MKRTLQTAKDSFNFHIYTSFFEHLRTWRSQIFSPFWRYIVRSLRVFSVPQIIYAELLKCATGNSLAGNGDRPDHQVVRPNFVHVAVGSVFVAASIPLHIQFNPDLNLPALVALGFFNFLFLFLETLKEETIQYIWQLCQDMNNQKASQNQ